MKSHLYHIVLSCIGLALCACVDQINLELEAGQSNVVVFGWITDEAVPYEIKLSWSNGYSDQSGYLPVSEAKVYVTDQSGTQYDFVEIATSGRYQSDPSVFVGQPGGIYQLTIHHGQSIYQSAKEELPPLSPVQDVFVDFVADPADFNVKPEDENFFVSAFVEDDVILENYYRWKVYVNNELRNKPEELVLFDDQFTNGNKFKYDASNVLFTAADQAQIQHMSLSKGAFEYYINIKEQTSSSALTPRIQPGIIKGNMSNPNNDNELVLGYFGASAVATIQVGK
ncbi:DUF4249 domain-containing protein [Reichenbachiella carrageenanivorans]|uniref:DUF4249 domain-containing protein n=1 Tax=Reichenbachiella carrageenanivorans TaxID=2979869 RepID=A0ABY6D623_9BACT|nr:DUF4249 domain-containing protein [Reichenbachiella carrageenanivorans]UXX79295.1 DUF4249 domain-containing protein [Reichenbachiella carrageenanivorans]